MSIFTNETHDLCKRTFLNLKFIETAKNEGQEVYETTQLINSLLGIIINISEKDFKSELFRKVELTRSVKEEWGIPDLINEKYLSDFIVKLRNATAHMNLTYEDKGKKEIKRIIFRNYIDNTRSEETWCCRYAVSYLRNFIEKLILYIEEN